MSFFDFIKSLNISPRFSWNKKIGQQSKSAVKTKAKVRQKQRNKSGRNYAAGRDMHIHEGQKRQKQELPYAYFVAGVGSNGENMTLAGGKVYNLSDQPIFLQSIEVLGVKRELRGRLVKANEEVNITQVSGIPMIFVDEPVYIDLFYGDKANNQYLARHATTLQHMATERYKIHEIQRPDSVRLLKR